MKYGKLGHYTVIIKMASTDPKRISHMSDHPVCSDGSTFVIDLQTKIYRLFEHKLILCIIQTVHMFGLWFGDYLNLPNFEKWSNKFPHH